MKKQYIHFVGIKGTNMTPLALIAKEAGFEVTGSDVAQEFITDAALRDAGITPLVGFSPEHITNPDLVITTGAHGGYDNIEVITAKEKKIKVLTAGEATGEFMTGKPFKKKFTGISISGTHGKTTTTAMIATILKTNKMDPSYIVGTGSVQSLGAPGHLGKGKYFVCEADEYATEPKHDKRPRFFWQQPTLTVFTNIEHDHPDIYPTIEDVRRVFLEFANKLPSNGALIACGDDRQIQQLLHEYNTVILSENEGSLARGGDSSPTVQNDKKRAPVITYGFTPVNTYVIERVHISGDQMFFWVTSSGVSLGEFVMRVTGEHNALNALAAIIVSHELGLSVEKIKKGLLAFQGSKRRLEFVGDLKTGAKAYDDYAHHPTEIKKTLHALRVQYPKKKIICAFQPHTYSRTKTLFDEFVRAFDDVDQVILTDIYASLREEPDPTISSAKLAEAMQKHHKDTIYLPNLSDVVQYIHQKRPRTDTVFVTMGAGDIYTIHTQLEFV